MYETTSLISTERSSNFIVNHTARLVINLIPTKLIGIKFSVTSEII
jgi:hypothetical protein